MRIRLIILYINNFAIVKQRYLTVTLSQRMARRVRFVRGARWILTSCASCTQRDAYGSRIGQLQSNWTLPISCNKKLKSIIVAPRLYIMCGSRHNSIFNMHAHRVYDNR